jgi:hypothetical protein
MATPAYIYGAIAVDDANVYWAALGQESTADVVMRGSRAGGTTATLAHGSPTAGALVSDGSNLYWTDFAHIVTVPVNGGGATTLLSSGNPHCIAVDDSDIYWTDGAHGVLKMPKMGGAPVTIAGPPASVPYAIAVDDTNVYWAAGAIMAVSKTGGTPLTLLGSSGGSVNPGCRSLALLGSTLVGVYTPSSEAGSMSSEIVSVPIGGAATATPLVETNAPAQVVGTSTDVFWEGFGTALEIEETAVDGGASTTLTTPAAQSVPDMTVASDGTLYWTTNTQVQSIKP